MGSFPLGQEVSLEEGTAAHSSILAWKIPWTEQLGGLQSMGSQRVGHYLETKQQDEKGDELKHPKVLNSIHSSGLTLD